MGNYGIKITLAGYSTTLVPNTAANIKKFALVSSVNLLKIKAAAKVTLNNSASTTIAHGFAYKPLFWVYLYTGSIVKPVYYQTNKTCAYIDSTNLFIRNNEGAARDFYYYIFYDPV